MFNLMSQLTAEDRQKIENYISRFGVGNSFIGLDAWLQYWATSKIKLYKMLNNSLIYKVPFECEKPTEILMDEIDDLLWSDSAATGFKSWVNILYDAKKITHGEALALWDIVSKTQLYDDKLYRSLKIKIDGASRELQIQSGMKPIRAMGKVIDYFKNSEEYAGGMLQSLDFEAYRIKHSRIFNDRKIRGNLVFSIHPLDFMTMSDNASDWKSCMSWRDEGCYHIGTVEMMNSNNVICCYIESAEPFYFNKHTEPKSEEYKWANKKWRQLIYVTKDIIVSGKPYPFKSEETTKKIIEIARELANKNLNWRYSFGPELYKDMKHVQDGHTMNKIRDYIASGETTKHNIIFDTKGMYNDMLNDQNTAYWCVRNKVKRNKIISYSGKAPCLCCGKPVITENYSDDYDEDYYNERYENTGAVICEDCSDRLDCSSCRRTQKLAKHVYSYVNDCGISKTLCDHCWTAKVRICPDCGKPMIIEDNYPQIYIPLVKNYNIDEIKGRRFFNDSEEDYEVQEADEKGYETIAPIFMHYSCAKKHIKDFNYGTKKQQFWGTSSYIMASFSARNKYMKYTYAELQKPEYVEGMEIPQMRDENLPWEQYKKSPFDFLKNF